MGKTKKTESTTKAKKKAEPTTWTSIQDRFLVNRLLAEKESGNMSENSFKKQTFRGIAAAIEEQVPSIVGAAKTERSVTSRWQKLKIDYKVVHKLREQSGFGWDSDLQMVTAPDDVWEQYIIAHKDAARFRKKPFPLYDTMHSICHATVATGFAAINPGQKKPRARVLNDSTSESSDDSSAASTNGEPMSETEDVCRKKKSKTSASVRESLQEPSSEALDDAATPGPPRRTRNTISNSFGSISTSLEGLVAAIKPSAGTVVNDPLTSAIQLLETESKLSSDDKIMVIDIFITNVDAAKAYLAIGSAATRAAWLSRRLYQAS